MSLNQEEGFVKKIVPRYGKEGKKWLIVELKNRRGIVYEYKVNKFLTEKLEEQIKQFIDE